MTTIKLQKNEKVNLTKVSDLLKKVRVDLSWETPENVFPKYDLDVTAFILGSDGKMLSEESIVFFNSDPVIVNGTKYFGLSDASVYKSGDELSGGVESVFIDVEKLSEAITEISIVVTIHKAQVRKHSFDKVTGAKMDIYNQESGEKIAEFHLDEVTKNSTAIQVGSFFQHDGEFIFQGICASYELDLEAFVNGYLKSEG